MGTVKKNFNQQGREFFWECCHGFMLYTMQYIVQMARVDKIPSKKQSDENYVDKLTKESHHSFSLKKSFFQPRFLLSSCRSMQTIKTLRHTLCGSVPGWTYSFLNFVLWPAIWGARGFSPKATHSPQRSCFLSVFPPPSLFFSPDTRLMHIHQHSSSSFALGWFWLKL